MSIAQGCNVWNTTIQRLLITGHVEGLISGKELIRVLSCILEHEGVFTLRNTEKPLRWEIKTHRDCFLDATFKQA